MKLNWNFWRGGGVIGQIPSVGGGGGGGGGGEGGMDIFWNQTFPQVTILVPCEGPVGIHFSRYSYMN